MNDSKSFLIVSQSGKPVRSLKINFLTVFIPLLFVSLGIAAFFIPPEIFRLGEAELGQKKTLGTQNELLHERFFATIKILSGVKEQITHVQEKKSRLSALTGDSRAATDRGAAPRRTAEEYDNVTPAALYAHLCSRDSAVSAFAARTPRGKNPFECLPVCKPVAGAAVISRRFGTNLDPFTGLLKPHNGVDFAASAGTPVVAAASGYVSRIENSDIWGRQVVIDHGNGIITVYAHLGSVSTGRGRPVKRGAIIGRVGVSGLTSGPHVHYEVWKNGKALDPEELFYPEGGVR
jgi:murein DD-endopeptidase MepM/ murein hydrolase activator NlpD